MGRGDVCNANGINRDGAITGIAGTRPGQRDIRAFRYQGGQFEDLGTGIEGLTAGDSAARR